MQFNFTEPLHAMIPLHNGICIVKETSVDLLNAELNEIVLSKTFNNTILKSIVYQDTLLICFDNEIIQLNTNDFNEIFRIESENEIRDVCIHLDIIILCFSNHLGRIGKNGVIETGPVDENLNLSALAYTDEYLVGADFNSKLVYFDSDFLAFKQIDYSSSLEILSENPPFPLLIRTVNDLIIVGTLNGYVIIVSPHPMTYSESQKISYTQIDYNHVYRIEYHKYIISDIIFNKGTMFISSNDRTVSQFELFGKLEYTTKYSLGMRAESLLIKDESLFVCGVDKPFLKKINF